MQTMICLRITGGSLNQTPAARMLPELGSIEVGKLADLVVLDDDIFQIDRNEIHRLKPAAVMMEGRWIHGEVGAPRD